MHHGMQAAFDGLVARLKARYNGAPLLFVGDERTIQHLYTLSNVTWRTPYKVSKEEKKFFIKNLQEMSLEDVLKLDVILRKENDDNRLFGGTVIGATWCTTGLGHDNNLLRRKRNNLLGQLIPVAIQYSKMAQTLKEHKFYTRLATGDVAFYNSRFISEQEVNDQNRILLCSTNADVELYRKKLGGGNFHVERACTLHRFRAVRSFIDANVCILMNKKMWLPQGWLDSALNMFDSEDDVAFYGDGTVTKLRLTPRDDGELKCVDTFYVW